METGPHESLIMAASLRPSLSVPPRPSVGQGLVVVNRKNSEEIRDARGGAAVDSTKRCPYCGGPVVRRRRTARWCSESCRVLAWRRKARQTRQAAQESRNTDGRDVGEHCGVLPGRESRNFTADNPPPADATTNASARRRTPIKSKDVPAIAAGPAGSPVIVVAGRTSPVGDGTGLPAAGAQGAAGGARGSATAEGRR